MRRRPSTSSGYGGVEQARPEPGNALTHQMLTMAGFRCGQRRQGMESFADFYRGVGDSAVADAIESGLRDSTPEEAARRGADLLVERSRNMFAKPEGIITLYDLAGETALALDWVERGSEQRDHQIAYGQVTPYSDELRAHPRCQAILERLAFPPVP